MPSSPEGTPVTSIHPCSSSRFRMARIVSGSSQDRLQRVQEMPAMQRSTARPPRTPPKGEALETGSADAVGSGPHRAKRSQSCQAVWENQSAQQPPPVAIGTAPVFR